MRYWRGNHLINLSFEFCLFVVTIHNEVGQVGQLGRVRSFIITK